MSRASGTQDVDLDARLHALQDQAAQVIEVQADEHPHRDHQPTRPHAVDERRERSHEQHFW